VLAGWTVLRFTWRDLVEAPERVVRTVRMALGVA
jgi:very-short-patch-repair endonuclease